MQVEPATKGCLLFSQAGRASVMTPAEFEPTGAKPSRFQIYCLNHSATVLLNVHPVGFEPTSTNTFKLELNPLDLMTMQTRLHISSLHVRQILTQK